jgi:hypothetical protein
MIDSEKLRDAVDVLLEQVKQQEQELAETKKTVNSLCRRLGQEPKFVDIREPNGNGIFSASIRADEYYGKTVLATVQLFLERKKRASTGEEILRGLEQGGFDFQAQGWKDSDRLRSLAIALGKNPKLIHRLPNGSYGLRSWYDESVLRRGAVARDGEVQ